MKYLIVAALSLLAGILIGWRLTWWKMQRVWQRNPYAFKTIVEGVIELRKKEGRL